MHERKEGCRCLEQQCADVDGDVGGAAPAVAR
jgi:hypothetical protein